jgi:thiamine-phosphate pyrophosphorylase
LKLAGLYAITPDAWPTERLLTVSEAVLRGGARVLQYRDKTRDQTLRREQATALLALCHRYAVPCLINDDLPLALEIGADGVHLGEDDGDLCAARTALGPQRILGVTCYQHLARATEAARQGADYVAFGAAYASASKPAAPVVDHALLAAAAVLLPLPVVAIGGITAANAPVLIGLGVASVAVIDAVFGAHDPRAAAQALSNLFSS